MPRWTQVKRNGLVITLERRGISSGIALRHLSRPRLHVQSAKDHTREETAFQGVGPRWWILKAIRTDWRCPGGPHTSSHPNYTWGTLGISNCGGPISRFSFGRWGSFLCAHWSPWSTFLLIQYHKATVWMSQMLLFQSSFKLQCGLYAVFSWVSDCTRASLTLSGERYIEQGPGLYFHKYGTHSFSWTKYKS